MEIKEIMTPSPKFIPVNTPVREAAKKMRELDVGFLPISDETSSKIVGTLTDRDIVVRGLATGSDLEHSSVDKVMSKDVYYCMENDPIEKAAESMKKMKVRRMIVLDSNKNLTGILSLGDVAVCLHDEDLIASLLDSVSSDKH